MLDKTPIWVTSTSTLSPGFIKIGGFLLKPTPPGVPVTKTSPALQAWRAGDVLVTGTPGGVGFKRNPPIFMKPGDKVEVEVTQIGVLSNTIKDEII